MVPITRYNGDLPLIERRRWMIKKYILGILKFFLVDSTVNIIGDLFEQPLIMWVFIGWGWLAILVMVSSFITQLPLI